MTFPRVYNETRGSGESLVYTRRGVAAAFRTDNENDGVRRNSIRNGRGRNFVGRASLLISFEKRRKPLGWARTTSWKFSVSARSRTEWLTNKVRQLKAFALHASAAKVTPAVFREPLTRNSRRTVRTMSSRRFSNARRISVFGDDRRMRMKQENETIKANGNPVPPSHKVFFTSLKRFADGGVQLLR